MARLRIFFLACLFYVLSQVVPYANKQLALMICLIVGAYCFVSLLRGNVVPFICIFFLIPLYPRDILFVYDAISRGDHQFITIHTITVSGLALSTLMLFLFSVVSLYKVRTYLLSLKSFVLFLFVILLPITISLSFALVDGSAMSRIFQSIKPFIFVILFALLLLKLKLPKDKYLEQSMMFLYCVSLVIAIRVPMLLLGDVYTQSITSFNFLTMPVLSFVALAYIVKNKCGVPLFQVTPLSLLFVQRSQLLFIMVLALVYSIRSKRFLLFSIKVSSLIAVLLSTVLAVLFPELFKFIFWKITSSMDFFASPQEGSFGVRVLELLNILVEIESSIFKLLFGLGPDGYYTFDVYGFSSDMIIDSKSFSYDQISSGKFYTVHSFVSFLLLKVGVVGLVSYLVLCFYPALKLGLKERGFNRVVMFSLGLLCCYYCYANIHYQIVLGFLWSILLRGECSERYTNSNRV